MPQTRFNGGQVLASSLPGGVMPTMNVTFAASPGGTTWTDMPAAATFFNGSGRGSTKLDLTNYSQARLIVTMAGTAAANGATIELRYGTTNNLTLASYGTAGSSAITCACNVTSQMVDSGWINLVAGAKADTYWAIVGAGGDGAIDPTFGNIIAQFR